MPHAFLISGGEPNSRKIKLQEVYGNFKPESSFENDPDLHLLESPTSVKIEDVRELSRQLSLKPYGKPPKVAIILESDKLTFEAQGALLKILEEPPGETIFILTTQEEQNLLPTIISRCQSLLLPIGNSPSLQAEEFEEVMSVANKIITSNEAERILLVEKITTKDEALDFCQKQLIFWRKTLLEQPTKKRTQVIRNIQKAIKYLQANTNPKLTIENLVLSYPYTPK